jgi:hypothetical protein
MMFTAIMRLPPISSRVRPEKSGRPFTRRPCAAAAAVALAVSTGTRAEARPGAGPLGDAPEEPQPGATSVTPAAPTPGLRVDFELAPSVFLPAPGAGPGPLVGVGLFGRIGVQMSRRVAVYYQAQGSVGWPLYFTFFNSFLTELRLSPIRIALGPSVDSLYYSCGDALGSRCGNGPFFGGEARVAYDLGRSYPNRGGFSVGLHVHPILFQQSILTVLSLGIAAELE